MRYLLLIILAIIMASGSASAEIIRIKTIIKVGRNGKYASSAVEKPSVAVMSGESASKSENLSPKERRAEMMHSCIESNIEALKHLDIGKNDKSYTELGDVYFNRTSGKDIERAFLCYYLGAKNNEPDAFYLLASFYETGYSNSSFYLRANTNLAVAFYEKAAELSVAGAQERADMLLKSLPAY